MPTLLIVMGRYVTQGHRARLNSTDLMTTAHIGDPPSHRRVLGPIAGRRLDVRISHLPSADGSWRSVSSLDAEADSTLGSLVTVGAFCAEGDLDRAVAIAHRVLEPNGRLVFLEHVGRPGVVGTVQRLVDPLWSSVPAGCHVDHDLPAALRRGGFLVSDLERFTMPSAVPLLRPWVQGVARSRA